MGGIFVSGTGTDVGKTYVTAAMVHHLRNAGKNVDAYKPVISGFDPKNSDSSDPAVLLSALGRTTTDDEIGRIAPWRFVPPLSPDLAAKAEGRAIDFNEVVEFSRRVAYGRGTIFIEGVGGIMVPLDQSHTVLDWMSALRIPVLLVAGSYLGTISHTLTALHVLAQRNLDIVGVVVSESTVPGANLDDTVETVARFASPIDVIGLPRLPLNELASDAVLSRIERLLM
ncbi:MAG: dethiobiotin synthase [Rhizobiales bacterium]|nr:dethiobiotin synthase [Hyphomicrobiales bacterium]